MNRCWYCGIELLDSAAAITQNAIGRTATKDHQTPTSRGGGSDESNLVDACRTCNSRKGIKTLDEYRVFVYVRTPHGAAHMRVMEALDAWLEMPREYRSQLLGLLAYIDVTYPDPPKFFGEKGDA
jgi:hypothetical protein